jgi:hypothetical protein
MEAERDFPAVSHDRGDLIQFSITAIVDPRGAPAG